MNDTATASAAEAQREIAEEFAYFNEWSERYQYLIDLGKQLPPLSGEYKTDAWRVQGCQSMVWLVPSGDAQRMHFDAASDSAIVAGLLALILRVYSDRPAAEITATEPEFIQQIGLAKHLSPTRSNGLASTMAKLKAYAAAALGAT
jgi:cysteine desulfuration protein SufE